ncbi:hypothetical protein ACKLNO_05825 [Neisseriaceae bacterium B1]
MLHLSPKQRKWSMYGNVVLAMILLIVPFYRYERWYFAVIMSGLNGVLCFSMGLAFYFAKDENRLSLQQWQYLVKWILAMLIITSLAQGFLPRN